MEFTDEEVRYVDKMVAYFSKHNYSLDYFHGNGEEELNESLELAKTVLAPWYRTDPVRFKAVMEHLGSTVNDDYVDDGDPHPWWVWLQTPHGRITVLMNPGALDATVKVIEDYSRASKSRLGLWWFKAKFRFFVWLYDIRNKK